jgi:uncharacterized protein with von Willebrand factor type A (vWA) domain
MNIEAAPLLDLLSELQRRNYPLGVSDYLLALDALAGGWRVSSREELIFLCQTLWAKSPEEQAQVAEALDHLLPKRLTEAELLDLAPAAETPREMSQPVIPPDARATSTETSAKPPNMDAPRPEPQPEASSSSESVEAAESRMAFKRAAGAASSTAGIAGFEEKRWNANPKIDYIGSLPVTRRQMKRAWRYLRRMRRIGTPVELDVQATIEQTHRYGVFIKPVLIARRTNTARLLILSDEGGSMVPFRRVTEPLLESAMQSGLASVAIFFFHDVINKYLYKDPSLTRPEPLDRILASDKWTGILIISDGGAARGNFDEHRVKQTEQFVKSLKRAANNVAWLNPTPQSRWQRTTAGALPVRCGVPMFMLDRAGLDLALDALRGRVR